jgi:hypothetical protein
MKFAELASLLLLMYVRSAIPSQPSSAFIRLFGESSETLFPRFAVQPDAGRPPAGLLSLSAQKIVLDRIHFCQGRMINSIRGATLIRSLLRLRSLQDTIISPASYACLTSQNTLGSPI